NQEYTDPTCEPGAPAPARDAGIQHGDVIVSVNGKETETYSDVIAAVENLSGPAHFQVERGGETVPLTVDVEKVTRPVADPENPDQTRLVDIGSIGVTFQNRWDYDALSAVGGTLSFTGDLMVETGKRLLEIPERVPAVVESIFGAERDPNTPVSVVGASRIGGEAVQHGLWELFFFLLASLNFFVGIFNLLPLLPLDGGHIAVTWYERVRDWLRKLRGKAAGGPVDYTKLNAVTMVIVVIGGAFVLLTITADIVNPIRIMQ
ncbi:zinc metalloprotease, partial [Streptomyces regensis]